MTLASGSRLGPYEILRPLGAGGMGEVYRGRDSKLGREVAIKVLPESLAEDPESLARFRVEVHALAALSHPNILAIHDFDTVNGVSYAVMELLEGETLREKMKVGTPIPQRRAIEYAREIAIGLSAAHEKGIVHRDLKPENVFITRDGRVKILDFGLAKQTAAAVSPADAANRSTHVKLTEPGMVVGTVGYMAPEQVRGLAVDHRADIFAFGTILYELLTGYYAFDGETPTDTMMAIVRDEPRELTRESSSISPGLARILRHCLEKSPEARAQSAHDVAFELESLSAGTVTGPSSPPPADTAKPGRSRLVGISVAALAVILAAVAVVLARRPASRSAAPPAAGTKRLAVLPFENLGGKDDDYFADGITDEVRAKLTNVAGLEVIARASSNEYKKTPKKAREIGQELGVDYLLTGTVRFATDGAGSKRVQVSPELSLATSAASQWAQPFDATLTDVFKVQGEIATRVAQALNVALSDKSRRTLEEKPTQNLAAYQAYLHGEEASQGLSTFDAPSLRRAVAHYEQAVALDAGFVEAWAHLSRACAMLYSYALPTAAGAARAKEAAERALSLAPDRPEGHQALGDYFRWVTKELTRALPELERAFAQSPGNADYATSVAVAEQSLARWDKALQHLEEARRLDPRSIATLKRMVGICLMLHRIEKARVEDEAGLALAPGSPDLVEQKVITFLEEGNLEGARNVLKAAMKETEPTTLVAYFATYNDLVWVLDEGQRDLLLRLTPTAFDNDRGTWALCLAQAYALRQDEANVRKYAEIARSVLAGQTAEVSDAQLHVLHAVSLAYLGRKTEAIREAERAVELLPPSKDAYSGPYLVHQLARVYILSGEHAKALDTLETLLKTPYYITKEWLRIDPNFDPLRKDPRFQKLAG